MARYEVTFPTVPPIIIEDDRTLEDLVRQLQSSGHLYVAEVITISGRPDKRSNIVIFRENLLKIRETL